MGYISQITEKFKREHLEELLSQCTEKERARFKEIFFNGVTSKELDHTIMLVRRTILANEEKRRGERAS